MEQTEKASQQRRNPGLVEETMEHVQQLGPWFHNLRLPDGTQTAPDHVLGDFPRLMWEKVSETLPSDMSGWTALDIGCNAGFYSFELARRGADVLAIDHDERYLRQAQWAGGQYGLNEHIEWRKMEVYQLPELNQVYDLVLFMGTFYHLRYPLLALDFVARCVRRCLVFQTLSKPGPEHPARDESAFDPPIQERNHMLEDDYPKMAFIEHRFAGDPTNWWVPNPTCTEALLRSAGLRSIAHPGEGLHICQPAPETAGGGRVIQAVRLFD